MSIVKRNKITTYGDVMNKVAQVTVPHVMYTLDLLSQHLPEIADAPGCILNAPIRGLRGLVDGKEDRCIQSGDSSHSLGMYIHVRNNNPAIAGLLVYHAEHTMLLGYVTHDYRLYVQAVPINNGIMGWGFHTMMNHLLDPQSTIRIRSALAIHRGVEEAYGMIMLVSVEGAIAWGTIEETYLEPQRASELSLNPFFKNQMSEPEEEMVSVNEVRELTKRMDCMEEELLLLRKALKTTTDEFNDLIKSVKEML